MRATCVGPKAVMGGGAARQPVNLLADGDRAGSILPPFVITRRAGGFGSQVQSLKPNSRDKSLDSDACSPSLEAYANH